jgi:UDP-N-acetyl-D-glucosamine dehydrogenase
MNALATKIEAKTALIGIVGLGYVGLPLAVEFAKGGYQVLGVDISQEKLHMLLQGKSYVLDVPSKTVAPLIRSGSLKVSRSYELLQNADTISICVKPKTPTPLTFSQPLRELKNIFIPPCSSCLRAPPIRELLKSSS